MGAATALLLAQKGARVAISGRREESLREIASQKGEGDILLTYPADVADRGSLERLFHWFDQELGELNVLVNTAGINIPKRAIDELSGEDWDAVLKINLTGAFDCMRLALERMRPRKDGLIVMINSVSGKRSNPLGGAAYNASKFGLTGLGSCAAEEERENDPSAARDGMRARRQQARVHLDSLHARLHGLRLILAMAQLNAAASQEMGERVELGSERRGP